MTEQPFYGSDAEAYEEDDDEDDQEGAFDCQDERSDFSLSDTGAQEYVEDVDIDEDDETEEDKQKRER